MKYRITVLTPVHVGAGKLGLTDFVYNNGNMYVIDDEKLARNLSSKKLVDDFCRWGIEEDRPDLSRYLSEKRLLNAGFLSLVSSRKIMVRGTFRGDSLLEHTSDPLSRSPYIPGSAVKGAIRTALLADLLLHSKDMMDKVADAVQNRRGKRETVGSFLNDILRGSLAGISRGPNTDLMRCLRISDAHAVKVTSGLIPVKVFSLSNQGGSYAKRYSIWVEVLLPGSTLEGDVSVDPFPVGFMTGTTVRVDLETILKSLKNQTVRVMDEDLSFFREARLSVVERAAAALKGKTNLRLGWGGGWLATSVGSVITPEDRVAVRRAYYKEREGFPFPKHRRIAVDYREEPTQPLGWAHLAIGEERQ